MTDLKERIEKAKAELEALEREMQAAACSDVGHRWVHVGGRNAGCSDECSCSIPVHKCSVCGDCDYGQNAEAEKTIGECKEEQA